MLFYLKNGITPKVLFASILLIISCSGSQEPLIRTSMRHYFEPYRINGFIAIEDPSHNSVIVSDRAIYTTSYTPASTFKICNSLIGLESGVLKDENTILPWDSIVRENSNWNHDQSLKEAFKNSTVWYYQEVARRVGATTMKSWLDKFQYGNADTTGGIDQFWLSGKLRISPKEQIDFIKKLHDDQLPCSKRSMDIVKNIMISRDSNQVVFHGKSGWGNQDKTQIGWFVGYAETPQRVVYFSNLVRMADTSSNTEMFDRSRREVAYKAVEDYLNGVLK